MKIGEIKIRSWNKNRKVMPFAYDMWKSINSATYRSPVYKMEKVEIKFKFRTLLFEALEFTAFSHRCLRQLTQEHTPKSVMAFIPKSAKNGYILRNAPQLVRLLTPTTCGNYLVVRRIQQQLPETIKDNESEINRHWRGVNVAIRQKCMLRDGMKEHKIQQHLNHTKP